MSWVSQANIKTIMTAIRNKFTTSDLVIANDAKDTGVELNYASQDGLVTVSPISTSASTEAALHLSNGDDTKKTELTQGTLSYVTGSGSSETYNYMSLLGDGVTFGKNGGGNVQLGGVADPTSEQQVATKNYVDRYYRWYSEVVYTTIGKTYKAGETTYIGKVVFSFSHYSNLYKMIPGVVQPWYSNDNVIPFATFYIDSDDKPAAAVFVRNISSSDITETSSAAIRVNCGYCYVE